MNFKDNDYRVVHAITDTDFYKFTMGQFINAKYPDTIVKFRYLDRNHRKPTNEQFEEIKRQISLLGDLKFTQEEYDFLAQFSFFKKGYLEFLKSWRPKPEQIDCHLDENGELIIYAEGLWSDITYYEIYILEIVSEVYSHYRDNFEEHLAEFERRRAEKIHMCENGKYAIGAFSEFGTRRRFDFDTFYKTVKMMSIMDSPFCHCTGTSNVYVAMKLGLKPMGTMAHELIMGVGQGDPSRVPSYSNKFVMEEWTEFYDTDNGIMLTDTIGTDCMLRDLNKKYAKCFTGFRHDSGDPIEWGEKVLARIEELGLNIKTTLLFSDSLNFEKATKIREHFKNKNCNVAFGIGTFISNDTEEKAPNIVMKMTECNGLPVAKLSDAPGKCMCENDDYIEYLQRCIDYRLEKTNR